LTLALDTLHEKRKTLTCRVLCFAFCVSEIREDSTGRFGLWTLDFRAEDVKLSPVAPVAQDAGSSRKAGIWLGLRHQIDLIKPAGSDRKWEQQQQGQQ
jgi:hypothetical protein